MVTENKIEKRYKSKDSNSARPKSLKNYQCDWCRRLLQNPSGLIRHKTYCVWNPELKNNVQGTFSFLTLLPLQLVLLLILPLI